MEDMGISTPYALAKRLRGRVSQATLYNYLKGGKELTTDKLEAVLEALSIGLTVPLKPIRIIAAGVNEYPQAHIGQAACVEIEADHWTSRIEAVDVQAEAEVRRLQRLNAWLDAKYPRGRNTAPPVSRPKP